LTLCRDADLAASSGPARLLFLRAPLQRGRASQSIACDRSGERDAHHIDRSNFRRGSRIFVCSGRLKSCVAKNCEVRLWLDM
jgi:hypothetical protein